MSTQYIINNSDSLLTGQTINGDLIVTSAITASTFYGDGSNLTNINGYSTTIVNISSAQILAMNSSQIELLPSLPYGQYYNIQEVVLEYTHISTPYTSPDFLQIAGYGAISKFETILTYTEPTFTILKDLNRSYIDGGLVVTSPLANETSVRLTAASNPTLGDGTLRAIITYTVRTFGA